MTDDQLIDAFVAAFEYESLFDHTSRPPAELDAGIDPRDWNRVLWQPSKIATPRHELRKLYSDLGTKLPPLYEHLILSWRWLEVDIPQVRLFENPPETDFRSLSKQIFRDDVFAGHLVAKGIVPFGLDTNRYDPVCFDTTRRDANGDCLIVRFAHEAMLSFDRIGESWTLWPSCRSMMLDAIESRP